MLHHPFFFIQKFQILSLIIGNTSLKQKLLVIVLPLLIRVFYMARYFLSKINIVNNSL